jgi:isopentenyldiphosphate isomerase
MGVPQRLSGSEQEIKRVHEVLALQQRYIDEEIMSRSEYEHVRESCRNEHELCAFWTSVGECESNRVFMLENCAAACRLCLLQAVNMVPS